MRSKIVVISWWSNCLGLACLHRLVEQTENRQLYVVQVGKSSRQCQLFRAYLPAQVSELVYPQDQPGEHSRVIHWVSRQALQEEAGLWFIDHDVILAQPDPTRQASCRAHSLEAWLQAADQVLRREQYCLCLPTLGESPAITQPAFWLSPARWPASTPAFDPVPFEARLESRRPDLCRNDGKLRMPEKDTLVLAQEALSLAGLVGYYALNDHNGDVPMGILPPGNLVPGNLPPGILPPDALPPFPRHHHLGGLFLFCGPILPVQFNAWMTRTVNRFQDFFESCPPEWLAIEDPVLLERLEEFSRALHD